MRAPRLITVLCVALAATAAAASAAGAKTVWLCRPGQSPDIALGNLSELVGREGAAFAAGKH
ncbi:MAG TPA: hypothetical protein VMU39_22035 [Solirubrobacteraceae bacterium]|nr:hypothetical protein [Solirubrobacteraceae bacterium]